MATIVQQQEERTGWDKFLAGLIELEFLTVVTGWLSILFARLTDLLLLPAIPLVILGQAYPNMVRAGFLSSAHDFSLALITLAPELVGAAAVIEAILAFSKGKKSLGWVIGSFAGVFVVLLFATIIVVLGHVQDATIDIILLVVRCLSTAGYSITIKVVMILDRINRQQNTRPSPVAVQQREDELTRRIDALTQSVAQVKQGVQDVQKVDTGIDKEEFEKLASRVLAMQTSVTEVHNHVQSFTQNMYSLPTRPSQDVHSSLACPSSDAMYINEVDTNIQELSSDVQPALPQPKTDPLNALVVPNIVVDGISQEKIYEVITAYQSGVKWSQITGNYSRTIKPIKEAYEQYVQSCTSASNQPVYSEA